MVGQPPFLAPMIAPSWSMLLDAKFRDDLRPTRADFDTLLHDCQAVADMPAVAFAEDLIRAYPAAKIILTMRDIEEWENSMQKALVGPTYSVWAVVSERLAMWTWSQRRGTRSCFTKCIESYLGDDLTGAYEKHYEMVRIMVGEKGKVEGRLLEFRVHKGWTPLCEFLDKNVPRQEFPTGNEIMTCRRTIQGIMKEEGRRVLLLLCCTTAVLITLVLVVVYLKRALTR